MPLNTAANGIVAAPKPKVAGRLKESIRTALAKVLKIGPHRLRSLRFIKLLEDRPDARILYYNLNPILMAPNY
jgi:hypothetical protein